MSTVAIGKRQPIAPNITPEGRARNRRVEFLVSASVEANLAAIRLRDVPASFFQLEPSQAPRRPSDSVQVLKAEPAASSTIGPSTVELVPANRIDLVAPAEDMPFSGLPGDPLPPLAKPATPVSTPPLNSSPTPLPPAPEPAFKLLTPDTPQRRPLGDEQHYQ
jgi:hypothetical protein